MTKLFFWLVDGRGSKRETTFANIYIDKVTYIYAHSPPNSVLVRSVRSPGRHFMLEEVF